LQGNKKGGYFRKTMANLFANDYIVSP